MPGLTVVFTVISCKGSVASLLLSYGKWRVVGLDISKIPFFLSIFFSVSCSVFFIFFLSTILPYFPSELSLSFFFFDGVWGG